MSAKKLYKLSEVCSIVGIKSYVLRFWESEFEEISYTLSSDGQKLYELQMVEAIAYVKKLLFEKKYTIEKAKQVISSSGIKRVRGIDFEKVDKKIEQEKIIKSPQVDNQKIAATKQVLNQIIRLTKSIKDNHNWK